MDSRYNRVHVGALKRVTGISIDLCNHVANRGWNREARMPQAIQRLPFVARDGKSAVGALRRCEVTCAAPRSECFEVLGNLGPGRLPDLPTCRSRRAFRRAIGLHGAPEGNASNYLKMLNITTIPRAVKQEGDAKRSLVSSRSCLGGTLQAWLSAFPAEVSHQCAGRAPSHRRAARAVGSARRWAGDG